MTFDQIFHLLHFRPLPGKCVIRLDPVASQIGSIVVPESARTMKVHETLRIGTIVAFSPRKNKDGSFRDEPFTTGDRVILDLTTDDLDREYICSVNARVRAVLSQEATT